VVGDHISKETVAVIHPRKGGRDAKETPAVGAAEEPESFTELRGANGEL
jgi:hypothetical protein